MSGWEVRFSNSRKVPYFYNPATHESTWDPPSGLTEQEIRALPGASKFITNAPQNVNGGSADQVRASHLLVKHRGSRRPASWKENNITRSEEEAREILSGYQAQIGDSASKFAELAQVNSDCSSHSKGGDLGWFGHGSMQKPFEEAAYSLQVGQISDIIKTDSGLHLVMRTG